MRNETDHDAPKTIESTQIVSFRCGFSCLTMDKEETRLAGQAYHLEAALKDGAVRGIYRLSGGEETLFRASHSFMSALQAVAAEHDLVQHNGLSIQVSGLPEDCGAALSVTYASGESIHAADNQDCFLSIAAMEALEALFYSQIEPSPASLDLSVAEEFTMENADGCFLSIRYPVLTAGYPHWDGTYRDAGGLSALDSALDAYNREIRMDQEAMLQYTLRPAAKAPAGGGPEELFSLADVYVTRSDSRVVSFYETVVWNTGLTPRQEFRRSFNFDTRSGKALTFSDVFTDVEHLPALLADAFVEVDAELASADDLAANISRAIEEENGQVCYALAAGGVHFFAEKNPLGGTAGIVHVMLSFRDHPELVKAFYLPAAEYWLTRLEYDTDYVLPGGTHLRMSRENPAEESGSILWTVSVNGRTRTEEFAASAPECRLMQSGHRFYLYAEESGGDIRLATRIYEITDTGLSGRGQTDAAIFNEYSSHPEHLLMADNDFIFCSSAMLMPYGLYRVGETGLPELIREEFGLLGPTLALTQAVEATLGDPYDPAFEGGPLPLAAGTQLTPFRTDKKSYLDFFDEDGNVCRFAIDGLTDEMSLNHFGTPEELLEPVPAG